MGKLARQRRKMQRDEQKRIRRSANRARYQSLAGTEANIKKKDRNSKSRSGIRQVRVRKRVKRMDRVMVTVMYGDTRALVSRERTWKQTHNTVSLKQFLKMVA